VETYLTQHELYRLTKRQRYSAQRRALDWMGWHYVPAPDGEPLVLRSYHDRMMGEPDAGRRTPEPDWSALGS